MQSTMTLLERALSLKTPPEWARELGLERTALHTAKKREHLSPAIAGALAEKLGEDVDRWIVVAALESEKDSACKTRMIKRLSSRREKPSFYLRTPNKGPSTRIPFPLKRGCSGHTARNQAIFTTSCVTPKRAATTR